MNRLTHLGIAMLWVTGCSGGVASTNSNKNGDAEIDSENGQGDGGQKSDVKEETSQDMQAVFPGFTSAAGHGRGKRFRIGGALLYGNLSAAASNDAVQLRGGINR